MIQAFFGGSFHPPHAGHDEMAQALLADNWIDCIHFVPTGHHPFKSLDPAEADGRRFDLADRKRWVRAWISSLQKRFPEAGAKIHLDEIELDQGLQNGPPSFTIDSLQRLKNLHLRTDRWVLVMGADLLPQLAKWKDPRDLFSRLEAVFLFARGGSPTEALRAVPEEFRPLTSWRVMGNPIREVSSTEIRERLAAASAGGSGSSTAISVNADLASLLAPGVAEVFSSSSPARPC